MSRIDYREPSIKQDLKADFQVCFVSFFTKFIGHIYMAHGIAKPGDPLNRVSKDLIWVVPSITIVALFANDIANSKIAIFKKAQKDQCFDNCQITGKFGLGIVGFVLSFCPTQSPLIGVGGMSGGLFIAQIIINVIDHYRQLQITSENLTNTNNIGSERGLLSSYRTGEQVGDFGFCRILLIVSKDALKIIPRGGVEALFWGLLLNWQPEHYQPLEDFCDNDPVRLLLLSSAVISVGASLGFPMGGIVANAVYSIVQKTAKLVTTSCGALSNCCMSFYNCCRSTRQTSEQPILPVNTPTSSSN